MVRQLSRQLARRQRRERLTGIALAALGAVVLVVALIALRSPKEHAVVAGTATSTPTATRSSVASTAPSTKPATKPATTRSSTSASTRPTRTPTTSSTPVPPPKLPLVVLNNTTVTGLAARASQEFQAGGWTVTSFGNYQNDILSTAAYYDPSVPNARQSATALQAQFPAIKRVVARFAELPAGPIVVVLTPDFA